MMSLTVKQRQFLRGLAHGRRAVITLGAAGLSPAALDEIDKALHHHELLKIKLQVGGRQMRHLLVQHLCENTKAALIQEIGRMAVIYRPAAEPRIRLPA